MPENAFYTTLENRGLIRVCGPDRHGFLQNLITQNLDVLRPGALIYGCLLTPQGKFLHDFFIHEEDECLLIDCEGGTRAADLARRLSMYKLRANVSLEAPESHEVFAVIGANAPGMADPRHPQMGRRSHERPQNLPEAPFAKWDEHRIRLCIPDGSRDLLPEQSTMDEGRIDRLSGVDYAKGCYVGQELTARMHYRGLGKKHLYAIGGDHLPVSGAQIEVNGKAIGEMRSRCGNLGIALLKDEALESLSSAGLRLINVL